MAKKQVIRLTENDLHNINKETVNKLIQEQQADLQNNNKYATYIHDICNPKNVEIETSYVNVYGYKKSDDAIVVIYGPSGLVYNVTVDIEGSLTAGTKTYDYYEPDETEVEATDFKVEVYDDADFSNLLDEFTYSGIYRNPEIPQELRNELENFLYDVVGYFDYEFADYEEGYYGPDRREEDW